ncbi:MAG TPA: superoxide dismutase family protein [Sphingobacteriaceae bacterium]|nr:superoxide dismutase family protein [Sphingobacteriaceae bacterium]
MNSFFHFARISAGILVIFIAFSCSNMRTPATGGNKQAKALITATNADLPGNGTINFSQQGGKVVMDITVSFPAKAGQSVAVHLHEHGDCGNMGNDAHGHWNPTNELHGRWGSAPHHLGDIGNISLNQSGRGSMQLVTDKWSLGTGASNDILGKAIIIHNGVDDYVTQPTGNAGTRIGCGVIQLTK